MIKLNEKYLPLWTDTKSRFFILTGGRGSGKSFAGGLFQHDATFEKNRRMLYTRYTMTSAEKSVIPEFKEKIDLRNTAYNFNITKNKITNLYSNSDISFMGVKTSSGNQTANLKSIKNLTDFVMDEADEWDSEEQFDKLDKSVRVAGLQNRVVISLNPCFKTHFQYERFFQDVPERFNGVIGKVRYIHTSYLDNIENLHQDWIDDAERCRIEMPEYYNHTYMGDWVDDENYVVFPKDKLKKSNVALYRDGQVVFAIDVADEGEDYYCCVFFKIIGSYAYVFDVVYNQFDTDVNLDIVTERIRRHNPIGGIVEVNSFGKQHRRNLMDRFPNIPIKKIHSSTNKHSHIWINSGYVKKNFIFNKSYDPDSEYALYMKHLTSYKKNGKSKPDDAPDGTCLGSYYMQKNGTLGHFNESLKR